MAEQGRHRVSTFSVVSVLWIIKMAPLVIHAAALELAEEVKETVFIGGVTTQLLKQTKSPDLFISTNPVNCSFPAFTIVKTS